MVNLIDKEKLLKEIDKASPPLDKVSYQKQGYYPNAYKECRNIWTDQGKCYHCGHPLEQPEELHLAHCKACKKSFA